MRSGFWGEVDQSLEAAGRTTTATELIDVMKSAFGVSSGDAFFGGSGGDTQLCEPLMDSPHWRVEFIEGDYHWTATASDGSRIEYTEGDLSILPDSVEGE